MRLPGGIRHDRQEQIDLQQCMDMLSTEIDHSANLPSTMQPVDVLSLQVCLMGLCVTSVWGSRTAFTHPSLTDPRAHVCSVEALPWCAECVNAE